MLVETIRLMGRPDPADPAAPAAPAAFTPDVTHLLERMRASPGLQGQAFGFDPIAGEFFFLNIWKTVEAANAGHDDALIEAIERQTGHAPRIERLPLLAWVCPPLETLVRQVLQQDPRTP